MSDERQWLLRTPRFAVEQVTQTLRDGTTLCKAVVRHPGAVVILPLVSEGEICLIRNYRVSLGRTLLEVPAGTLEPGEDPLACAHRELIEETGYRAGRMEGMPGIYPSPGILDERMQLFVASQLTAGDTAREAGEEIENVVVSWEEALRMIDRGEIEDGKTIALLLLYQRRLNRPAGKV